jgi:ketosteroid isomerase-like protein
MRSRPAFPIIGAVALAFAANPPTLLGQEAADEASVCAAAEAHYVAARNLDMDSIVDQHTPDFTFFLGDGSLLWTFESRAEQMAGFQADPTLDIQMYIRHCNAQIYGDAGIATYYLTGSITTNGQESVGTWRVTEVWIRQDGGWKEAHHHESPLLGSVRP